MWEWNDDTMELYHYGVKGMKWGVRRARPQGGISGMIRRKQMSNASNARNKIVARQKQNDAELRELRGYEKHPSKIGSSRVATAIRNHQIKKLQKGKTKLDSKKKDMDSVLSELSAIDKYQREKRVSRGKNHVNKYITKAAKATRGALSEVGRPMDENGWTPKPKMNIPSQYDEQRRMAKKLEKYTKSFGKTAMKRSR